MKKLYLVLAFCLVGFQFSFAQKEANVWCFGYNAGLDFNSGSPVAFSGVQVSTNEGCASISDTTGQLLFYTDGLTVWNKNHVTMTNGTGLMGGWSGTQSGLIVRKPGSYSIYYVFTAPENNASTKGLNYNEVDMTLSAGLGAVTTKNQKLMNICDEKVTATMHANGSDIWVVATTRYNDTLKSFLVTPAGVNPVPVTCFTSTHMATTTNSLGYLKISASGKKLGVACFAESWQVYDFNNATAMVSNPITIPGSNPYGIDFSLDETKLYGTENLSRNLYQWDLSAGSQAAIISSKVMLASGPGWGGGLQYGPDKKLYVAWVSVAFVSVINNPNGLGTACNLVVNAVPLASGSRAGHGLPNIFYSYLITPTAPKANFNTAVTTICQNACITYNNLSQNATTYQWTFPSGTPSSSTSANPTVCYPTTGLYDAQLIATSSQGSDTLLITNYITVNVLPAAGTVSSLPDTICAGNSSQLTNTGAVGSLQWQLSTNGFSYTDITAATLPGYSASGLTQTTYYRMKATNSCGTDTSAAAVITVIPNPTVGTLSASRDSMCAGTGQTSTLTLASSSGNLTWEISTDGISYGPLSGASGTTYTTPPGLSQNMYYRVIAAGGSTCPPDTSAPLIIHIQPFPLAFYTETVSGTVAVFSSVGSSADVISYSWDFGDGGTSSLANPTHTYSKSDTFEVCLTVFNGSNCAYTLCKDVFILGTGIEDLGAGGQLLIYPNPVKNKLTVNSHQLTVSSIEITNVLGQLLMNNKVNQPGGTIDLDVNALATGVYFITVRTTEGVITRKFMKE